MIDQQALERFQSDFHLGKVYFAPSLSSTNDLAAEWLHDGCPDLSLIVADEQTQGKGRAGRKWHTNPGAALAFTLIITAPKLPVFLYTGLSAVAVIQTLAEFTADLVQIKWPNDILIADQKVCGILAESLWSGENISGIILGIGINIFETSLNIEEPLRLPATFLQKHSDQTLSRLEVLERVVKNLTRLNHPEFQEEVISEWNHSLAYKGQQIEAIRQEGDSLSAILLGVTQKGELRLQLPDSNIVEYNANEIHKIRSIE